MTSEILDKVQLRQGGGAGDPRQGICVMELVSWLAGADVTTTDRPDTACPLLTRFAIALNDTAPSARTRNTLKNLAPLLVGSRNAGDEKLRADHILRAVAHEVVAPELSRAGRRAHAQALRAARTREEIGARALAAIAEAPSSLELTALLAEAARSGRTDLAEQILVRAERLSLQAGGARRRLTLWRAMRKVFEEALLMGAHGSALAPRVAIRLEELAAHLWPEAEAAKKAPELPGWLEALVHGPASEPMLAAPKKAKKQLEHA